METEVIAWRRIYMMLGKFRLHVGRQGNSFSLAWRISNWANLDHLATLDRGQSR